MITFYEIINCVICTCYCSFCDLHYNMKIEILSIVLLLGLCWGVPDIPDIDEFQDLKERCEKKAGKGTFEKIKTAKDETQSCIEKLIDVEEFKKELEQSKKTGSMDEVFDKYCKKRPQFRECVKKTYDAVEPCLEDKEKAAINFTSNILQQLGDFACFNNGDRLAMFVAEGGVECIKSRSEGIQNCINATIQFNPDTFTPKSIPSLIVDKKVCSDIEKIQNCIVKDLEDNCTVSTPSNIIDALFRFVKKITCKDVIKRSIFSF